MQQITWTKSNILDWYIPHRTRTLNADHTSSVTFKYRTLRIDSVFECGNLVRVSFVSLTFKYGFLFLLLFKTVQGNVADSQENKPDYRLGPMTAYLWTDLEWSKHSYRPPDKGWVFVIVFGTNNRFISNKVIVFFLLSAFNFRVRG